MYEARKICNFLLAKYDAKQFDLTNLRINKLVFFIHAEALRTKSDGLVRNHFEAWQFGPVIRPVFEAFKVHGDKPVSAPALFLDYATGTQKPVPFDDIDPSDRALISETFDRYCRFSTGQLVSLSHEANGPWDIVYRASLAGKSVSPRIPNELIRRHYVTGETKAGHKH